MFLFECLNQKQCSSLPLVSPFCAAKPQVEVLSPPNQWHKKHTAKPTKFIGYKNF